MIQSVAKKYVKAIMMEADNDQLKNFFEYIKLLDTVYSYEKTRNIIFSPTLSKEDKYNFLVSLLENSGDMFNNFLKILVENDRVSLIPSIKDELRYQLSIKENRFVGQIISSSNIDENSKRNIEEKLSQKFNANIELQTVQSDYPGIKIEIEDLGVEISFSIDRLKAQMTEYILKAI